MAFPKDFIWGAACSSYQTEGAWDKDGKGLSIWDEFVRIPDTIRNGETGDVACDLYHRYAEDIEIMKRLGLKAFRFSLSWPRIQPEGRGAVNEKGFEFYDKLIDMLLEAGIEPYVNLYHWDLPSALQKEGGWLSRKTAEAFGEFAEIVGRHFNGRVKNYMTLNEPQCFVGLGYLLGTFAPGLKLTGGDVALCMHNVLIAHGLAVSALRKTSESPVKVAIVSTGRLCYPNEETPAAVAAAKEATFLSPEELWFFNHQWIFDPIVFGHYPENAPEYIKQIAKGVPAGDWDIITQRTDYLGINVYHGVPIDESGNTSYYPGYPRTAVKWPVTPLVMRYGFRYIYERYNMPIIIAENGLSCNDLIFLDGKVHDPARIDYLTRYLRELKKACEDGVPVKGYFHWSFTDNFEWASGYDERFGLVYIDFPTQRRIVKDSAVWYSGVISENGDNL